MEEQNTLLKNQQSRNTNCQAVSGLFLSGLIFGICFGVFTNDPEKYGGEKCEKTRFFGWSKAAFIYYLALLGCSITILPCILYAISSATKEGKPIKTLLMFFNIVMVGLIIASFTIFIGLCVTYGDNDPCGKLRDFVFWYMILAGIGLGLSAVGCCCVCCCGVVMMGALAANANSNQNLEQRQGPGNI